MKMNLLDIVQDIMSDMNSDFVNSIVDTEESLQVAQIVKSTFFEMISMRDWSHLSRLMPLKSFSNDAFPTYLITPNRTKRFEWVTYNIEADESKPKSFRDLRYLAPESFLRHLNSRDETRSEVTVYKSLEGVDLKIDTSTSPQYWTSMDDNYILLDSFDQTREDTVQGINTQAMVLQFPDWKMEDDFVPDLPDSAFSGLLAEAKSTCFLTIKAVPNQKAEQQSTRQQRFLSFQGWKNHGGIKYPNYGRRSLK